MKLRSEILGLLLLLVCVPGCDSRPRARSLIVIATQADMSVRFETPMALTSQACVYSPKDWADDRGSRSPSNALARTVKSMDQTSLEATIPAGGALELTRFRYPDIEEDPQGNFLIDRIEIRGSSSDRVWEGRRETFSKLTREGGGPLWYLIGSPPRYVYYYK